MLFVVFITARRSTEKFAELLSAFDQPHASSSSLTPKPPSWNETDTLSLRFAARPIDWLLVSSRVANQSLVILSTPTEFADDMFVLGEDKVEV